MVSKFSSNFSNYWNIFDNLFKVNALTDYAWWNGRDGTPNYYWNGSKTPNSKGCACYETDSCEDIGHDHRTGFLACSWRFRCP